MLFTFLRTLCWVLSVLVVGAASGQNGLSDRCDSLMFISGSVVDESGRMIPAAMVVNRGMDGGGQFVDQRGQFLLAVCPGDTIAFGAIGFHTRERVAPVQGKQWEWEVRLHRLSVEVGTAEVVAPRVLREILRDFETL